MAGRTGLRWLLRRDPGLAASRRALRVAVVATAAFMLCRYGVGSTTAGIYAAFGAIGFGVLSQVVGTPHERTRTMIGCFVAGTLLLAVGTLLAGSTWAATAGMLVVGVVIGFLPIGGPRPAGVANGLQLLYILPSFPPFAPETLPARVLGLAVGMGFLALADRLLWPPRPGETYACRAAGAARALADLLDAVLTAAPDLSGRRAAAAHAAGRLKLLATPWEERPTGPGAKDRGLAHLGASLRSVQGRIEALLGAEALRDEVLGTGEHGCTSEEFAGVLRATAAALRATAAALRGRGPLPEVADLDAARDQYVVRRLDTITTLRGGEEAVAHARTSVAVGQVLFAARTAVQAARVVVDPAGRSEDLRDLAWWAVAPPARLWTRRVRANLTLRSVYLQNAVRLGIGLGLARFVAGELDLSHGLWVLLATLTLMRTSVTSTRATLVPAIVGTAAGAVVAAPLLALVGPHTWIYAVLFPILCVGSVLAGQLIGMIAAQACFTVLVAALFAQLAPAGPSLAGARLLDVAVGAAVGIGVGALVWPAGGHGEVRHEAARCLSALADLITASSAWVCGTGTRAAVAERLATTDHQLMFFETDFLQYRSERRRRHEDDVDWFTVLGVSHRAVRTMRSALDDPGAAPGSPASGGPDPATPWPDLVERFDRDAHALAEGYGTVARALTEGRTPACVLAIPEDFVDRALRAVADAPDRQRHPRETLRLVDAWGRLGWSADDLAVLGVVLTPAPARRPQRAMSVR